MVSMDSIDSCPAGFFPQGSFATLGYTSFAGFGCALSTVWHFKHLQHLAWVFFEHEGQELCGGDGFGCLQVRTGTCNLRCLVQTTFPRLVLQTATTSMNESWFLRQAPGLQRKELSNANDTLLSEFCGSISGAFPDVRDFA